MKLLKPLVLFLIINFGGLALGSWLMGNSPLSDWYTSLNQAPWTPPGWAFGVAWTLIMICFSIYLVYLFRKVTTPKLKGLFILQVFLNVIWNYVFFNQHLVFLGLVTIIALTVVVFYFFFNYKQQLQNLSYLLLPYMVWLIIATSLNAYILLNN
ncbi:TspO/MBR family protein [Ulvibacter litoralis]|uniref:Tryptophan-rich sensory protein n=1 Tax=Ulvibacter litoralis TaxID=227084 RepID=A0A1G7GZU9_9FLAO|nr:TspO/MBR family protein [Ulvibacter litoralis]GHC59467.1 tryptophan-rich sensory protein [Ulvibacter litoralis]SDE93645.1 tryptophan-rich sensory protein [Ulvibacter litoralis]